MADWDDVDRLALALPEAAAAPPTATAPGPSRARRSRGSGRCGEPAARPWAIRARAPRAPRRRLLADAPDVYFTTPHFDGYPAVLVRLEAIDVDELEELLAEAWLARAPKRLAKAFLDARS